MRISDWSSDVCSSDLHRHNPRMKRPPIIAMALLLLATAALAAPAPAAADQNDSRLDALFTRLLESPGPVEAQQVEGRIWQTWMQSDDGAVQGPMRDGAAATARGDYPTARAACRGRGC